MAVKSATELILKKNYW